MPQMWAMQAVRPPMIAFQPWAPGNMVFNAMPIGNMDAQQQGSGMMMAPAGQAVPEVMQQAMNGASGQSPPPCSTPPPQQMFLVPQSPGMPQGMPMVQMMPPQMQGAGTDQSQMLMLQMSPAQAALGVAAQDTREEVRSGSPEAMSQTN